MIQANYPFCIQIFKYILCIMYLIESFTSTSPPKILYIKSPKPLKGIYRAVFKAFQNIMKCVNFGDESNYTSPLGAWGSTTTSPKSVADDAETIFT